MRSNPPAGLGEKRETNIIVYSAKSHLAGNISKDLMSHFQVKWPIQYEILLT